MRPHLPIDDHLQSIARELKTNDSIVISATPGSGKTTRLPVTLLGETNKKVLVLEPRRVAAISACLRIAEENHWELGKEVGYQVRFDKKFSPHTRLLFFTEALLNRKLAASPTLEDIGIVVLDEFHERSIHVDVALAALKELQQLERPDLKIIVLSATLEVEKISRYLGKCAVISIPGKVFPLKIVYEEKPQITKAGKDLLFRIQNLVTRAFKETDKDILCFLPGVGEILKVSQNLAAWATENECEILELHGQLPLLEQKKILTPNTSKRRIILSTNVAESSLTVPGVAAVVDCGLVKQSQIHPKTGFDSLELVKASKASATQRAGRSARLGPGTVYRAWTKHDELSMRDFDLPELFRTDLAETLLLLATLGVPSAKNFSWYESPPTRLLENAERFLFSIGAIDASGRITKLGNNLHQLPVHPRIGALLLAGKKAGFYEVTQFAALLSEPNPKFDASSYQDENDLLAVWNEWLSQKNQSRFQNVRRTIGQLNDILEIAQNKKEFSEETLIELLCEAFADRLCRRRKLGESSAVMVGGRGVRISDESTVRTSEYFLAIELAEVKDGNESLVRLAVGLSDENIRNFFLPKASQQVDIEWDEQNKRFWAVDTVAWQLVTFGKGHKRPATADEVALKIVEVACKQSEILVKKSKPLEALLTRIRYYEKKLSKSILDKQAERRAWSNACFGLNSLDTVLEKDLVFFFSQEIEASELQKLEESCPPSLVVPSGMRYPIVYSQDQGPLIEVRLQELFGLQKGPILLGEPLTFVLLAPNFRPVQVTKDLASFWKNAYSEVKKELRARYPKHSWPEDPHTAQAQSKGRPRNSI